MKHQNKLTDEELQEIMDPKHNSGESSAQHFKYEDAGLYEFLMNNLGHEPALDVPENFIEDTITKAIRRKRIKDYSWKILLYISVCIPICTISFSVVYLMGKDWFWQYLEILEREGGYLIFAAIGIVVIQLLDKLLVKNKLNKTLYP